MSYTVTKIASGLLFIIVTGRASAPTATFNSENNNILTRMELPARSLFTIRCCEAECIGAVTRVVST